MYFRTGAETIAAFSTLCKLSTTDALELGPAADVHTVPGQKLCGY